MIQASFAYPADVTEADDGVTITLPDVPEAITGGASRAAALDAARDCLETALAGRIADNEPIPAPSAPGNRPLVAPGAVIAAKVALYMAMRETGTSTAKLAETMQLPDRDVRSMLDPARPTEIGQLEAGLAALGRRMVLTVEPV